MSKKKNRSKRDEKEMSDFDSFLKEQLEQEGVRREYYRLDPFYRLADQLILLRKQRGLTQKELAEKAGTTQAVVSRLENVSVRASLETVVRLAEALGAVVELNLAPVDELQAATMGKAEETPAEEPCAEMQTSAPMEGAVYFGRAPKAACQEVVWFQPDPLSFGLRTQPVASHSRNKKRQPEIA